MNLNKLAKDCVEIARKNGFTPKEDIEDLEDNKWYLATKIALIHSEASEMLESLRVKNWGNLIVKGIDVIIRTLEFLSSLKGVDIEKSLLWKIEENKNRPYRHGGKLL